MIQEEILIKSTLDGTMQPSLFYKSGSKNRPLLVGLHTWSFDRFNQIGNMLPLAEKNDFNLLLPEFRGSNLNTNPNCTYACGSDFAKQDVKDAIDFVCDNYDIDKDNVFLLGLSGGGHMALIMAGMCPEYFKAIGAYVPITDLEKWMGISFGNEFANPMRYAKNLYLDGELLEELTIPEGITKIGDYVFAGFTNQISITIPSSVTSIGKGAFYDCKGLTSITIPDSVTSIGDYAFSGCTGLTSIVIPDSVTSIGTEAFYYCKGLTSIVIPDGVTSIGNYAFYSCTGLISITIP